MTDQSLQFPRFFVTAPALCPYLPGKLERKVFTELRGDNAKGLNDALSRVGFRRSQSVAYRPACEGCSACVSVRVVAKEFRATKNMRRILSRNKDIEVTVRKADVSEEQFTLLKRYLDTRHAEGGMADMSFFEYAEMVQHTPVDTRMFEYRIKDKNGDGPGQLIAACLSDVMGDGLSMVYSFYEPDIPQRSLGTYIILQHIQQALDFGLDYVYLGYWIKGSDKMDYKSRFRPIERLSPTGWKRLQDQKEDAGAKEEGSDQPTRWGVFP